MNPLIIQHTPCTICDAKAGEPCMTVHKTAGGSVSGVEGHGARVDDFAATAPYEARLQVYQEITEALQERFKDNAEMLEELKTAYWPLTEAEGETLKTNAT